MLEAVGGEMRASEGYSRMKLSTILGTGSRSLEET
jgi:hypothetical protein